MKWFIFAHLYDLEHKYFIEEIEKRMGKINWVKI